MKREDALKKLGYGFPKQYAKQVILCSDAHNEADDQYAIVHHLLTPSENVLGIVACHYEYLTRMICARAKEMGWTEQTVAEHLAKCQFAPLHGSVDLSLAEITKLLKLMDIDDVPVLRGEADPIAADGTLPQSASAEFIVEQARSLQQGKLYLCCIGTLTDAAVALSRAPEIADRVIVV